MKLIKTNIANGKTTVKTIDIIRFENRADCFFFETEVYEAELPKANTTVNTVSDDIVSITVNWD